MKFSVIKTTSVLFAMTVASGVIFGCGGNITMKDAPAALTAFSAEWTRDNRFPANSFTSIGKFAGKSHYIGSHDSGVLSMDKLSRDHWLRSGLPKNRWGSVMPVVGLAVDPHSSRHVFAAIEEMGLYESNDAGGSWVPAKNIFKSISEAPRFHQYIAYVGNELFYGSDNKLFASSDNGSSWNLVFSSSKKANIGRVTEMLVTMDGGILVNNTKTGLIISWLRRPHETRRISHSANVAGFSYQESSKSLLVIETGAKNQTGTCYNASGLPFYSFDIKTSGGIFAKLTKHQAAVVDGPWENVFYVAMGNGQMIKVECSRQVTDYGSYASSLFSKALGRSLGLMYVEEEEGNYYLNVSRNPGIQDQVTLGLYKRKL